MSGNINLLKQIKQFLLSTPEVKDPARLRSNLSQFLFLRILILSSLLSMSIWESRESAEESNAWILIIATVALSLLNIAIIRYAKHLRLAAYSQLIIDVCLSTATILITGSSITICLYPLVILAAALALGSHGAVTIAAVAGISYALLASGVLPWDVKSALPGIFSVYVTLIFIGLVSVKFTRRLEDIGSVADKNARELISLSKRHHMLFEDISDGIITLDNNRCITNINRAARSIIGLSLGEIELLKNKKLPEVLAEYGLPDVEKLFETNEDGHSDLILKHPETNREVHLRVTARPVIDEYGNRSGFLVIFNDLSHIRTMEEKLMLHERMTKLLSDSSNDTHISGETTAPLMIGESKIMQKVSELVERVALSDASVLITGESGTGKELVARTIHNLSTRKNKPFVAINCGAIPENLIESELFGHKKGSFTGAIRDNIGLFRQANGGTIFLDEIGELPAQLQSKLLRALQERIIRAVGDTIDTSIDIRVVAATNLDLKKEIKSNRFREDLYYRLNVVNIIVPPLRDRKEDIPLLVRHFIGKLCGQDAALPKLSPETLQSLMDYSYPGNIRELENIIEHSMVLGGQAILPEHLPKEVINPTMQIRQNYREETEIVILPLNLEAKLENLEKLYLIRALEETSGLKKAAADLLGLNFRSFRYRLKKYGLSDNSSDTSDDNI